MFLFFQKEVKTIWILFYLILIILFLGEWRVIYVAKFVEAVYVLHVFQKKTRKTRRKDIEIARQRYKKISGQL